LEVVAESVAGRQNLMQLHMCRSFDLGDGDGRPLLYAQVNVRFFDGGDVLLLLFSFIAAPFVMVLALRRGWRRWWSCSFFATDVTRFLLP